MTKLRKDEYLNLDRAAGLLGVSYRALKRMIEEGKIPYRRLGERTYRISRKELDDFIRQRRREEIRYWPGGTGAAGE